MFKRKPKALVAPAASIPEGPTTLAAREKVTSLQAAILDLEDRRIALESEMRAADQRLVDAAAEKADAENLIRQAATTQDPTAPTGDELAALITQHVRIEAETARTRERITSETERLGHELGKLQDKLGAAQHSITQARFAELNAAYIKAIKPLVPLAVALREAANKAGKPIVNEPLLIDPDADYGKQVLGAAI